MTTHGRNGAGFAHEVNSPLLTLLPITPPWSKSPWWAKAERLVAALQQTMDKVEATVARA